MSHSTHTAAPLHYFHTSTQHTISHSTQTAAPLHYFHTFTQHSRCHTAHKQLHHCTISIPSPTTVDVTQHTHSCTITLFPHLHPTHYISQHTNSCTIALFPYLHPTQ